MSKIINLEDFKKYKDKASTNSITKEEMIEFEKDIFYDDDDMIFKLSLKEM